MAPKIHFEIPTQWCRHHLVGDMVSNMTENFFKALINIDLEYMSFQHGDSQLNQTDADTIIFSYHRSGHKKNTWYLKESALPNFFSMDRGGYSGWSDFSNECNIKLKNSSQETMGNTKIAIQEYQSGKISKYPQMKTSRPTSAQYVFFPLQISDDSVVTLSYLDYYEAILIIGQAAARHGTPLVIKRHPLCTDGTVSELISSLTENFDNITISNNNVHDLIQGSRAVICCNSGVGLEALMYSKPVYCYGHSDYASAVHLLHNEADIELIFKSNLAQHNPKLEPMPFIDLYMNHYCFDGRAVESIERKIIQALDVSIPGWQSACT